MAIDSRDDGQVMATPDLVLNEVRGMLPEGVDDDVTVDTSLFDLGLDSLGRMDVVNRLEKVFGIRFPEEELYDLETCGDLIDCIEMLQGEPPKPAQAKKPTAMTDAPPAREIAPQDHDLEQLPECVAFDQRLEAAATFGLVNPFFRVNDAIGPGTVQMDGRELIRFTNFGYLGMETDPRVIGAAKDALERFGTSAGASRLVGGDSSILEELDEELARLIGTEAAVTFPSGYGTNASLFGLLFGADDLILYDELAHNSIVQGATLSKAATRPFPHNDATYVDELLADIRGRYRRVIVAIEGVYSMDGDFPHLPTFIDVKRRHKAMLYVDEAHSIGVMGPGGRGICEHFGVDPADGDIWMGTISKALGSGGGYLAGGKRFIQFMKYNTPSFVFATACSPANAAAALASVRLLQEEPERVARLHERSSLFLKLARDLGLDTGGSQGTPIIPIILGNSARCIQVSQLLRERGVDAQPILYPAVQESAARVRFFITANHTEEQIVRTVEILGQCVAETADA